MPSRSASVASAVMAVVTVGTLAACVVGKDAPVRPSGPWMRPGEVGEMTAAYATLRNAARDTLRIVAVEIDAAGHASLHRTVDSAGTARMVPVDTLAIAPGDSAAMAPGGLHVMAHGLRVRLLPGDTVAVRFLGARGDTTVVRALVRQ